MKAQKHAAVNTTEEDSVGGYTEET